MVNLTYGTVVDQRCECGAPMEQQPLWHWVRTCDHHKQTRYYANVAPEPADMKAFHQLTGAFPPMYFNGLFGFGPKK